MLTVTTPAAASALTTLAAAKASLSITVSTYDAALTDAIDRASSALAGACGRVLGVQRYTETLRPNRALRRPALPVSLTLPGPTLISVTADSVALVAGTDYEADTDAGLLWRLSGGSRVGWVDTLVVVVYDSGWILPGSGGRNLPAVIEDQCLSLVVAAYTGAGRDRSIASETTEGVGAVRYFDRSGSGGVTADMLAALTPYRIVTR